MLNNESEIMLFNKFDFKITLSGKFVAPNNAFSCIAALGTLLMSELVRNDGGNSGYFRETAVSGNSTNRPRSDMRPPLVDLQPEALAA